MRHPHVPEDWTAEMALDVVAFLDEVIQTIWDIHGRQMGLYLEYRAEQLAPAPTPTPRRPSLSAADDEHLF